MLKYILDDGNEIPSHIYNEGVFDRYENLVEFERLEKGCRLLEKSDMEDTRETIVDENGFDEQVYLVTRYFGTWSFKLSEREKNHLIGYIRERKLNRHKSLEARTE